VGFGKERGEYVAGSAVACIMVDADMRVTLPGGTNDQGKADLNGEPVFRFEEARTLEKDADSGAAGGARIPEAGALSHLVRLSRLKPLVREYSHEDHGAHDGEVEGTGNPEQVHQVLQHLQQRRADDDADD
jgi:hypothetical protein